MAAVQAVSLVTTFTAIRGLLSGAATTSWVEWPAWLGGWTSFLSLCMLIVVALLFPDGTLPSRRWRWIGRAVVAYFAVVLIMSIFERRRAQPAPSLPSIPAPFAVAPLSGLSGGTGSTPLEVLWLGCHW